MSLKVFIVLAIFAVSKVHGKDQDNHLDLDANEKKIFEEFKTQNKALLDTLDDFGRSDIFLIRFLRARGFNMELTNMMFKDHVNWRKENKIVGIENEDWTDMARDYPMYLDGVDKKGRPILYFASGPEWDVSAARWNGRIDKLVRWATVRAVDRSARLAFEKNQTRFTTIVNLKGFSTEKHLCGLEMCFQFYTEFIVNYELNYPEWVGQAIVVNAPPLFDVLLQVIQPAMTGPTVRNLKSFGEKTSDWQPYLFQLVEKDQLNKDLGGTRKGKYA